MGRPRTINSVLAEVSAEAVGRLHRRLKADPDMMLTEGQARVLKTLAETQVIIQRRKPEDEDEPTDGMTLDELEEATAEDANAPSR